VCERSSTHMLAETGAAYTATVAGDTTATRAFLERWPSPPALCAIHPEKEPPLVIGGWFADAAGLPQIDDAIAFVEKWSGRRNLYFHIARLQRVPANGKATKADVEAVAALHADIDLKAGIDQDTGMTRIESALSGFDPKPSVIVRSGGGCQAFWLLREPVRVGGDEAAAADVERRTRQLEERFKNLDALKDIVEVDSTHNVDRIMRIPGTPNLPGEKKRAKGRQPRLASVAWADWDLRYDYESFEAAPAKVEASASAKIDRAKAAEHAAAFDVDNPPAGLPDKARVLIASTRKRTSLDDINAELTERGLLGEDKPYAKRAHAFMALAASLKAGCASNEEVAGALCAVWKGNANIPASERRDAAKMWRHIERAVSKSHEPKRRAAGDWPDGVGEESGRPHNTYGNTKAALGRLGIKLSYDEFRHRFNVEGMPKERLDGRLSDAAVLKIRDSIYETFCFYPNKEVSRDAIESVCHDNSHNPVVEWLDALPPWDGVPRLDKWLHTYLGAPDTKLNTAYGRKFFCATVRRCKRPGSKWDHELDLQGPQGIGKSTICEDIAIFPDVYTDAGEVGASQKEMIETLHGKQIVEIPELAGHSKAERSKNKASITRKIDSARLAYDKYTTEAPRSTVSIGTLNPGGYLTDPTGERRNWNVAVTKYEREKLLKDKPQIYAEAVAIEPKENLWLDTPELEAAHDERTRRLKAPNAYVENLSDLRGTVWEVAGQKVERVSNAAVRAHLLGHDSKGAEIKVPGYQRNVDEAMMAHGWTKATSPLHCLKDKPAERGYWRPVPDEPTALKPEEDDAEFVSDAPTTAPDDRQARFDCGRDGNNEIPF